ncbi:MAG: hypothetical protein IS632_09140 [Thaumarchaeota archaeon]|nr:hypothetical protein [Nitrososphaerota archaeon]
MRKRYKIPLIVVAVLVGFMVFSVIYYQLVIVPAGERAAERELKMRTVVDEAVDLRDIYTDIRRYPEKYDSPPVRLSGEAITVGGGNTVLWWHGSTRVVIDGDRLVDGGRVVDGDIITVYGVVTGINRIGEIVVDPLIIQLVGVDPTLEECVRYGQALPGC